MGSDALSVAANAFSIVGLADVILRSAKILWDLISRTVKANSVATSLLQVLQGLVRALTVVRTWACDYDRSDFAILDGQSITSELLSLLSQCSLEVTKLIDIAKGVTSSSGLWGKVTSSLKFATSEEEYIRKSIPILNFYTNNVSLLIQSRAGNDLMTLRKCHTKSHQNQAAIQKAVENVDSRAQSIAKDVQNVQLSTEKNSQTLCLVSQTMENVENRITPLMQQLQESHKEDSQKLDNCISQVIENQNCDRGFFKQHSTDTNAGLAQISAKLSEITFTESLDNNIKVEGYSVKNAIEPLRYMQAKLGHVVETLNETGTQTITKSNLDWFTTEMNQLMKRAYYFAGSCNLPSGSFRGPFPGSFRMCLNTKRSISTLPLQFSTSFSDPNGFFIVEHMGGNDIYGRKIQRYRFACIALDIVAFKSGIAGLFDCTSDRGLTQVNRQLRVINVVQDLGFLAEHGIEPLQKMFSEKKASPFDFDQLGYSLLGIAAFSGNIELASFLLEQGADPHMCMITEKRIYNIADIVWYGTCNTRCSFTYCPGQSVLRIPLHPQTAGRLTTLAQYHGLNLGEHVQFIPPELVPEFPISWWLEEQKLNCRTKRSFDTNLEIATEILSQGIVHNFPDDYGRISLLMAAGNHAGALILNLLSPAAGNFKELPTLNWDRFLNVAMGLPATPLPEGTGIEAIVLHLLKNGADPNSSNSLGQTALHVAATAGIAKILLNWGAEIDAKDRNGRTPLASAVKRRLDRVAKFLVGKGADVSVRDFEGRTPLAIACSYICPPRKFFENKRGRTPRAFDCWRISPQTIETLLANGTDVNARDNYGRQPLWYALFSPRLITCDVIVVIKLLLAKGADTECIVGRELQQQLQTGELSQNVETGIRDIERLEQLPPQVARVLKARRRV